MSIFAKVSVSLAIAAAAGKPVCLHMAPEEGNDAKHHEHAAQFVYESELTKGEAVKFEKSSHVGKHDTGVLVDDVIGKDNKHHYYCLMENKDDHHLYFGQPTKHVQGTDDMLKMMSGEKYDHCLEVEHMTDDKGEHFAVHLDSDEAKDAEHCLQVGAKTNGSYAVVVAKDVIGHDAALTCPAFTYKNGHYCTVTKALRSLRA